MRVPSFSGGTCGSWTTTSLSLLFLGPSEGFASASLSTLGSSPCPSAGHPHFTEHAAAGRHLIALFALNLLDPGIALRRVLAALPIAGINAALLVVVR